MSLAYHGNYCGPGWSAGGYQNSVKSSVGAIDPFDASCKQHDAAYATPGSDLATADLAFAGENLTGDPKRFAAGLAVGLQGLGRLAGFLGRDNQYRGYNSFQVENPTILGGSQTTNKQPTTMARKKANIKKAVERAAMRYSLEHPSPRVDPREMAILEREMATVTKRVKSKAANAVRSLRRGFGKVAVSNAPVSIGTSITASKPVTRTTNNGVVITGREFFGSVLQTADVNWQVASLNPVHPAYYPASIMGNTSRMYQYFRFRRAVVHFVTKEPTSNGAEIAVVYSPNMLEPVEDGSLAQFLPRVMTKGHAVLGPIWQNHSMEIPCDNKFRKVDAFNAGTNINDNVAGEVQVYILGTANRVAGYLLLDYELEFSETMITPHLSQIPMGFGNGGQYSLTLPATAVNSGVIFNSGAVLGSNVGEIYRWIISADESTFGTGTTPVNAWAVRTYYAATSTTQTANLVNFPLTDGQQLFVLTLQNGYAVYTSLEGAISGNASQQLFVRTPSTGDGTFVGWFYKVRFSPLELAEAD